MRTTMKDVAGCTLFSLVYGFEAVLPVEIEIPSIRIAYYSYEESNTEKRVNLDLLHETRGNALLHSLSQKQKMTHHFNRLVKPKQLQQRSKKRVKLQK